MIRVKSHKRKARRHSRESRRGVLLLVVLSMLVLFMLIGTAFLMSSDQSRKAAKEMARVGRLGNYATKRLERALLQVVRDTENPYSVVRYHSLLRDLYGTDGFQGVVYRPQALNLAMPVGQVTRFAGATAGTALQQLGPTQGQLIDVYVRALGYNLDDPLTPVNETPTLVAPDLRHLLKLDRNLFGQAQLHALPLTKGYYNGCLLTITSGPATGQSARIVDYEYIADIPPSRTAPPPAVNTRLFRFRVMAFPRADGQPLQINPSRTPEIADLAGASFIVNGRAFNGTGVGYNPLAAAGSPRLSALHAVQLLGSSEYVGEEIALTPNSVYLPPLAVGALPAAAGDPYSIIHAETDFTALNTPTAANYGHFPGLGDADESYDAPDYQNIYLALLTVTPRAQGRVVQGDPADPETLSAVDPNLDRSEFLRLDLDDLPLPSFHRPDLINFWYHRLFHSEWLTNLIDDEDERALAILEPYINGVPRPRLDPRVAAQITALKRKISLRPLREDHPNFDGGNPFSVPQGLPDSDLVRNGNIAIPYWEAVGPWDVDNDNDGVADSIWIDLGDPVQELEDGTRYKAIYAILIIDLDGRLNVNAHGLVDHIDPAALALEVNSVGQLVRVDNNLAGSAINFPRYHTNLLAQGLGYGPAEISLRPLFPAPWMNVNGTQFSTGNRQEDSNGNGRQQPPPADLPIDDLATLQMGRVGLDGQAVSGKYGFEPVAVRPQSAATPGWNYEHDSSTAYDRLPDLAAQIKFFNYPLTLQFLTAFGTPPDLFARYALGLDYFGQPVYEVINDRNDNNVNLPRPLLNDSPYELDLSSPQRSDTWSANFPDAATAFSTSLGQNDDAAFSASDLERVLRAHDADSGTLPSRLWDVASAFDPLKLMEFDPLRVTATARAAFNSTGDAERLAAAQLMAGVNRRVATTHSFDLPVASQAIATKLAYGADGLPGKPGVDDDGNGGIDDSAAESQVYNPLSYSPAVGVDDYHVVMGANPPTSGTLLDFVRYRIVLELKKSGILAGNQDPTVPAIEARLSAIINGGTWFAPGNQPRPESGIMAPDLMAGKRMDVNRPFGDGQDNAGDGIDNNNNGIIDEGNEAGDPIVNSVVDEPLEAGDPFLDVNGNGKWDPGEPYIDLIDRDADDRDNPEYDGPLDQLWKGITAEPIAFDYTNGQADPVHPQIATSLGMPVLGGVRNLESQGRQLYARHLYCLMLALVDDNYIAPWDEADPQIGAYLDHTIAGGMASKIHAALTAASHPDPVQETRRIMLRKLTCRTIAQWAVNCADQRDPDVIMTPFEYDENPWDGWGVLDRNGINVPLDGDPGTNENGNERLSESQLRRSNMAEVINWNVIRNGGPKTIAANLVPGPHTSLNQTRGVVWGAERPELLITETLAFHDRRTEDLESNDTNGHDLLDGTSTTRYDDIDLDQGLRPRGSLFIEVYNPWSTKGQYPAELYSRLDSTTGYARIDAQGVELGRLSNFAADTNGNLSAADSTGPIKRSPVWRVIVVEEWPNAKNTGDTLPGNRTDLVLAPGVNQPKAYEDAARRLEAWSKNPSDPPPFRPTNPDWDVMFDATFLPKQQSAGANKFEVAYPYIEREFYFTTDKSPTTLPNINNPADWDYATDKFKLRIPDRSIRIGGPASSTFGRTQKFVPIELETATPNQPAIAPVLPGRYGVIGSAGTKYDPDPAAHVYTTTIGRREIGQANTPDAQHFPNQTRRIELRPSTNPDMQQILVASNGGDPKDIITMGGTYDPYAKEIGRDNELINENNLVKNVNDSNVNDALVDGFPDNRYYLPCVSIPIEGMSVSEPPWGWEAREKEAADEEAQLKRAAAPTAPSAPTTFRFRKLASNKYEGRYVTPQGNPTSYDKPLDVAPELNRTGTTANYRMIHLQRLANPLLPWNPLPKRGDGSADPDHRPNLPINPYRTIDSSSVNLTAFNGASLGEGDLEPSKQMQEAKMRPWIYGQAVAEELTRYLANMKDGKQVWFFRSLERGSWSRLNYVGSRAMPDPISSPQRVLWAQEPAMVDLTKPPLNDEIYDLIAKRQMTMRADEVPDIAPDSVRTNQKIFKNHADMVMEHTLGFGNESFGLLFDAQGAKRPGIPMGSQSSSTPPTPAAIGAPAPGRVIFTHNVDQTTGDVLNNPEPDELNSTNPWLAWGNRPYVSAEEILNVPAGSSAQMLRQYTVINPNVSATAQPNPYNGTGINATTGKPLDPKERLAMFRAPFGHLLNVFGTADRPARIFTDAMGKPEAGPDGNWQFVGAPHFYRILEYVQVPSRYVGTDTMLTAEIFNDVPGVVDTVGTDITGPLDPRYFFQPPFNKVSRERDPGMVNLNTVPGRRIPATNTDPARHWSEVFDGIMHRNQDGNQSDQLSHLGPAWRDVVLSRRGYAQFNALPTPPPPALPIPIEKPAQDVFPDVFAAGLNPNFPTMFANPFRSADAGDLVPLPQLVHHGVDASMLRRHHFNPGPGPWGAPGDDNDDGSVDDTREAGFGRDELSFNAMGNLLPTTAGASESTIPLFSERFTIPFIDGERNPYFYYQPMTRLGNLVTNRSGVFAIWITVGYFEVEKAPDWSQQNVRERFGATMNDKDPATIAGLALYNRVYPDGYMLGREVGSDTGNTRRHRGFYIVDRTEEVGFKPGEDLNVEKMIRLRRRIE